MYYDDDRDTGYSDDPTKTVFLQVPPALLRYCFTPHYPGT